jgi:hypothetical protein
VATTECSILPSAGSACGGPPTTREPITSHSPRSRPIWPCITARELSVSTTSRDRTPAGDLQPHAQLAGAGVAADGGGDDQAIAATASLRAPELPVPAEGKEPGRAGSSGHGDRPMAAPGHRQRQASRGADGSAYAHRCPSDVGSKGQQGDFAHQLARPSRSRTAKGGSPTSACPPAGEPRWVLRNRGRSPPRRRSRWPRSGGPRDGCKLRPG